MDWNGTMCRQRVLTVMPDHVLMSEIEIITDVGLAAPGKGPKLLFLRALTTLLTAGAKEMPLGDAADPYLTGLCYFNALRELGGARRIVEDEMRAKLADYGTRRRRLNPSDQPFENRELREVLELTSRESTDKVAAARDALARSALAGC